MGCPQEARGGLDSSQRQMMKARVYAFQGSCAPVGDGMESSPEGLSLQTLRFVLSRFFVRKQAAGFSIDQWGFPEMLAAVGPSECKLRFWSAYVVYSHS